MYMFVCVCVLCVCVCVLNVPIGVDLVFQRCTAISSWREGGKEEEKKIEIVFNQFISCTYLREEIHKEVT